MRKFFIVLLSILIVASGLYFFRKRLGFPDAISGASISMALHGNSLYHQTALVSLATGPLQVAGEIKNGGNVDLTRFYKHEIVVKESVYHSDSGIQFRGAFRYMGYSLFDLLHPYEVQKKNAEMFRPQIDLYIVIENAAGDSVVFSWSEIFHTGIPHQVLLATEAGPIVPHKKEVSYDPGKVWKVVAATDLFAFRELINPVRITIRSFDRKDYPIDRDKAPLYSGKIDVFVKDSLYGQILPVYDTTLYVRYYSTFYGMGMGYHPARFFEGPLLKAMLPSAPGAYQTQWNRKGLVCFAALDGYRTIYSYSELFNRADQVFPILSVAEKQNDGGFYRIFHPADFYADRSVKALSEIYFFQP